jgi:hypothetical protein
MLIKFGDSGTILGVKEANTVFEDQDIKERFFKLATAMKKIAPKAEDFLYFAAVMMHAAERNAINDDGTPKKTKNGEDVKVWWEKLGNGGVKFKSNDPDVRAYKNSRNDIFPESELIAHHKKWIHKPLCVDHKSDQVDSVRGFIVDTHYDPRLKRVIALCALDRKSYPELARKVETGYQSDVSMGTGVGRAVCYDCGKVAKAEKDFCSHMTSRSTYGEINLDLEPIELSIVVIGADQKAKIKEIIASAEGSVKVMEDYVNKKADNYSASINTSNGDGESNINSKSVVVNSNDINTFRDELESALNQIKELSTNVDKLNYSLVQSGEAKTIDELSKKIKSFSGNKSESGDKEDVRDISLTQDEQVDSGISFPPAKIAFMMKELKGIKESLSQLTPVLGNQMSKKVAYNQGTEEAKKYPVDPAAEKTMNLDASRIKDETNGQDGLMSDDESKKEKLSRASIEEREIRRRAIVEASKEIINRKLAYLQGTEEPKKYPVDPGADKGMREDATRIKDETSGPDGMMNGDKQIKDSHQRTASYKLRFSFVKDASGNVNVGKSQWQVLDANDKLVTVATVDQLAGGNPMLYDMIANKKDFGKKIFAQISQDGVHKFASSLKKVADESAPPAPAPDAAPQAPKGPAAGPGADPMAGPMAGPSEAPAAAEEKTGDPKEQALDLAEQVSGLSSDLLEAVRQISGQESQVAEEGKKVEASDQRLKTAFKVQKALAEDIVSSAREAARELQANASELTEIVDIFSTTGRENHSAVLSILKDAMTSTSEVYKDSLDIIRGFKVYADGVSALVKQARASRNLSKIADEHDDAFESEVGGAVDSATYDDSAIPNTGMSLSDEDIEKLTELVEKLGDNDSPEVKTLVDAAKTVLSERSEEESVDGEEPVDYSMAKDMVDCGDDKMMPIHTVAARNQVRTKLAASAGQFGAILQQAHKGGTQAKVPASGDLAWVETGTEAHEEILAKTLNATKARKEAEAIHQLVAEGQLEANDVTFASLIANGVDKETIAFYKELYNSDSDAKQFAKELTQEAYEATKRAEMDKYRVRIKRAYDLAYQKAARGLIGSSSKEIERETSELAALDDAGFEAVKRVTAQSPLITKSASMPQMGMVDDSTEGSPSTSLADQMKLALRSVKPGF